MGAQESFQAFRPQQIANDLEMILAADTLEVQNEQAVYHAVVALRSGIGNI